MMTRDQQVSPFSTASRSMAKRCAACLYLSAIVVSTILASACSVDLSKLRVAGPPASDGAADVPMVPDMAGTGMTEDDASPPLGQDSTLGSADLTAEDAIATQGDAKVLPDSNLRSDSTGPDFAQDSSDLGKADEDAFDASADIPISGSGGSGGSGGSNGTGGAGAASGTGGAGGGSGGTGGVDSSEDSNLGGTGGSDVDPSASPGDAIDTSSGGTGGNSGGSTASGGVAGTGGASVDPDLVLWYKFDESSGTAVADSSQSGSGGQDGTLGTAGSGGSASYSTDCRVGTHAVSLATSSRGSTPAGGYVTIPAPENLAPGALTIALWVKLAAATSSENWERIFDFGNGSTANAYLYLTARASDATPIPLRFGISNTGHTTAAEQRLESPSVLTANVWHHIAIVLPTGAPYAGLLYLDGVGVATNKAMTLHMSDVGATTLNWLGRSPFTADPLFNGSLDDFRIYKRALSATEISALFTLR